MMNCSDIDTWIEENYPEIEADKLARPENTGPPVSLDYRYVKDPSSLRCKNCGAKNFKCISISKIQTKDNTRTDKIFQCQTCGLVVNK